MASFAKIFLVMVCVCFCQQAEASTKQQVVDAANGRFQDLSKSVRDKGPETIVNSINTGQEKAYQNHPIGPVVGDAANGGHMIWVEDGKVIAASSASSEIGKNVEADPLVVTIIAALKASEDEKVVVSYDNGKKTAVAWGRKALMGGCKIDEKMPKFFCYVAFDNPGT